MIEITKLKVYLILHPEQDGVVLKWFDRYKSESRWTSDIDHAKKFFNKSQARSYITTIFKQTKLIPKLLEISGGEYQIFDEKTRVKSAILKIEKEKLNRDTQNLINLKARIETDLKTLEENRESIIKKLLND